MASKSESKPKKNTEREVLNMLNLSVQKLDVMHVRELLESKPNLDTNFGGRLLSYIAYHAMDEEFDDHVVALMTDLVKAGAKLNMIGTAEFKREPELYEFLHIVACRADNEEFVKLAILMIDHGADVNARNGKGNTPLHIAVGIGSVALAKALVEKGANVDVEDKNQRNTIQIAIDGILEGITKTDLMLPLLIKANNANEKTIQRRGLMAFRHSLFEFRNLIEPMKVLFDLGIPVDVLDNYCEDHGKPGFYWPGHWCMPLNYAAHFQHLGTVEFLASRGADVNKYSICGRPPITTAFQRSNPLTIQCLIRLGADINKGNKDDGQYPLHNVCYSVDYHTPGTLRFLLNLGADINVKDKDGKTPLALLVKETKFGKSYEVIIQHLAFLSSNGKRVNENDLKIINERAKAKEYYEKCLVELEKMKETTVCTGISVFDLIAKDDKEVSFLVKNKDFSKGYSEIKASFRGQYPNYFEKLKSKMELVIQMRSMLDTQKSVLDKTVHNTLPEIVLQKIIDQSYTEDIKILKREFYLYMYRRDITKAGYTGFSSEYDEEICDYLSRS